MGSIRCRGNSRECFRHCDDRQGSHYHRSRSDARILEPPCWIVGNRLPLELARSHTLDEDRQDQSDASATHYDTAAAGPTDDHDDTGPADDHNNVHHPHAAAEWCRSCHQSLGCSRARADRQDGPEKFTDNFTSPSTLSNYQVYGFYAPDGSKSCLAPGHTSVTGGMLVVKAYKDPAAVAAQGCTGSANDIVTGGVKMNLSQTYGKYEVRMRVDNGLGVSVVALLWPTAETWPPEIDFTEDNGAAPRTQDTATEHWGTATNPRQINNTLTVNLTQWHTVGVEWSPGKIVYTMDGTPGQPRRTSMFPTCPCRSPSRPRRGNAGRMVGNMRQRFHARTGRPRRGLDRCLLAGRLTSPDPHMVAIRSVTPPMTPTRPPLAASVPDKVRFRYRSKTSSW